ncbi:hypothetical protein R80B4_00879 [Fibrobacteres bacterium R8-0-B4]
MDIDLRGITYVNVCSGHWDGSSWSRGYDISDLSGIEYFTALEELNCGYNHLTALDLSNNTVLTSLACDSNQLTELDISKNPALKYLSCDGNRLTTLDVSNHTALEYLDCGRNQLTALDLSKNTALKMLYCGDQTRSGYIFDGWYRDAAYNDAWDNEVSTNLTLYAKWTPDLNAVSSSSPSNPLRP